MLAQKHQIMTTISQVKKNLSKPNYLSSSQGVFQNYHERQHKFAILLEMIMMMIMIMMMMTTMMVKSNIGIMMMMVTTTCVAAEEPPEVTTDCQPTSTVTISVINIHKYPQIS